MNQNENTQGLTLFQAAGLIDPLVETVIGEVYKAKALKNSKGDVVGHSAKTMKPDDVRKELGLPATKEGREQTNIEIRKRQDAAWAETKAWLINNAELTLAGFQQRTNAKGVKGTTIKLIEEAKADSLEAIEAKAAKLGYEVKFTKKAPVVNVESTPVKPAELAAPTIDNAPADNEAAVMAQLEAEEAARLQAEQAVNA